MNRIFNKILLAAMAVACGSGLVACSDDDNKELLAEAKFVYQFTVEGTSGTVYYGVIDDENNEVTIKVDPFSDVETELNGAVPTYYLSMGATCSPDAKVPQDFSNPEGVKYTVTSYDKKHVTEYTVKYTLGNPAAYGTGIAKAQLVADRKFSSSDLGYPGTFAVEVADPRSLGDLIAYPAFCTKEYAVIFSRAYAWGQLSNGKVHTAVEDKALRYFSTKNLNPEGNVNLGGISASQIVMVASDPLGHLVALVDNHSFNATTNVYTTGTESEFYYWTSPISEPISMGKISRSFNHVTLLHQGMPNMSVVGDVTTEAVIILAGAPDANGTHDRVKVSAGKVSYDGEITTGVASNVGTSFQMACPFTTDAESDMIVGANINGTNRANGVIAYLTNYQGTVKVTLPEIYGYDLQSWGVGTGFSLARQYAHRPYVAALTANGKRYMYMVQGSNAFHGVTLLEADDLHTLAHTSLNYSANCNKVSGNLNWSYGGMGAYYWDESSYEGYLVAWLERYGMVLFRLSAYE